MKTKILKNTHALSHPFVANLFQTRTYPFVTLVPLVVK